SELLLQAPIVQDVPHDQDVGGRQRVGEEVAGVEAQPARQAAGGDVVVEGRPGGGQVESAAGQVRVGQCELGGHASFGGADDDDGVVAVPGELLRDRGRGAHAQAGHG